MVEKLNLPSWFGGLREKIGWKGSHRATLLFVYALGRGVPVVLAGTFAGALNGLQNMSRWSVTLYLTVEDQVVKI